MQCKQSIFVCLLIRVNCLLLNNPEPQVCGEMWGIARNCANRQQVNTNEVKCGNLKIHQYIYHLWLAWLPEFLSFSLLLLRKLVSSSSSRGLVFILQLGHSISQQIPFSTYACSCAPGESQHITLIIFNKWLPSYNYAIRIRWSADWCCRNIPDKSRHTNYVVFSN